MLITHLNKIEKKLAADFDVSASARHPNNKGMPREIFIKEFLRNHLANTVAIGSGEIIDCDSSCDQDANQFDIVIYKNNYPKIHLAEDINAFLIESVVATIEVKSTLDKKGLEQAIFAAYKAKRLKRNIQRPISAGYIPPNILNYVVAYKGPSLETVMNWIEEIYHAHNIKDDNNIPAIIRANTPSQSIDGVFIFNKGFVQFDNSIISWRNHKNINQPVKGNWIYCDTTDGNLLLLFLLLLNAMSYLQGEWVNLLPYLKGLSLKDLKEREIINNQN